VNSGDSDDDDDETTPLNVMQTLVNATDADHGTIIAARKVNQFNINNVTHTGLDEEVDGVIGEGTFELDGERRRLSIDSNISLPSQNSSTGGGTSDETGSRRGSFNMVTTELSSPGAILERAQTNINALTSRMKNRSEDEMVDRNEIDNIEDVDTENISNFDG
jgi:hypothetical protein